MSLKYPISPNGINVSRSGTGSAKNPLAKSIETTDKNAFHGNDQNNYPNTDFFGREREEKALSSLSSNLTSEKHGKQNYTKQRDDSVESQEENSSENPKNLKEELKETKSKLKIITNKLTTIKKERDTLQKDNKTLQEEVLTLQSSLRQMIPGFSNTSSTFPMFNEVINNVNEFYKYDCEDIFFDLLCPELNMKGIILFYYTAFHRMLELVSNYFAPSEALLKKTACLNNLDGPIMNVLRKSYQSTWKNISKQCLNPSSFTEVINEIQSHLKLGGCSQETNTLISNFLMKMGELLVCFYISDPPVVVNYKAIGTKVIYNPTKHEPLDGFIKNKEECIIILPPTHKNSIDGELSSKALVLQVNYEIPN